MNNAELVREARELLGLSLPHRYGLSHSAWEKHIRRLADALETAQADNAALVYALRSVIVDHASRGWTSPTLEMARGVAEGTATALLRELEHPGATLEANSEQF